MQVEESKVFRLSWAEVNQTINEYLLNQLGHYIPCKAQIVKRDYWTMELYPYEMSVKELERLLSQEISGDSVPEELQVYNRPAGVFTLDMVRSERLLSAALGHGWDWSRMDRDFLWLIRIPGREEKEPGQSLWIQGKEIFLKDLASRDKLFAHLREYGANVLELADFCDGCQTSYDELLYWDYPLCDDRNRRFFLVLDREGIVKLPYDSNDFHDEAVFLLDDASFVSAEEMERFCEVWDSRSLKLRQVLYAMERFLRRQEEKSNEEAKD